MNFLEVEALGLLGSIASELAAVRLMRLWERLRGIRDGRRRVDIIGAERARAHPGLCDYLSHHLAQMRIKVGDQPAQLMTCPLKGQKLSIPVALIMRGEKLKLGKPPEAYIGRFPDWESAEYVRIQRMLGRVVEDNSVYTAQRLDLFNNEVVIEGGLSTYGPSLATQDALEWELLLQASKRLPSFSDWAWLDGNLPLRHGAEAAANYDLLSGQGRSNALAIATLIVHKTLAGDYRMVVVKRSSETAAHPDLFHVIPAGMFQPEFGSPAEEWSIRHNVLKEYGEELFDKKLNRKGLKASYFYKAWPPVRALLARMNKEQPDCIFKVTGLVVNLLNFRPEVCTLLLIKDAKWWDRQQNSMSRNWEYAAPDAVSKTRGKAWLELSLDDVEEGFVHNFGHSSGLWVPSGLAALWLGVDAARKELSRSRAA